MAGSSSGSPAATLAGAPPDLLASGMHITAYYGTGLVVLYGVCVNIGLGPANGPFTIQVGVDIVNGGHTTYFKNFVVPQDVTIAGLPIRGPMAVLPQAESDVAGPPSNGVVSNTFVAGPVEAPLEFFDVNSATYTPWFTVDVYGQVTNDINRANLMYRWPGPPITYLSLESQQQEGPVVVRRARNSST